MDVHFISISITTSSPRSSIHTRRGSTFFPTISPKNHLATKIRILYEFGSKGHIMVHMVTPKHAKDLKNPRTKWDRSDLHEFVWHPLDDIRKKHPTWKNQFQDRDCLDSLIMLHLCNIRLTWNHLSISISRISRL